MIQKTDAELDMTREVLTDWENARSINASGTEIEDNDDLREKVSQLEKVKSAIESFIAALSKSLKSTDKGFMEMIEELEPDRISFLDTLTAACALYNYKYTVEQKNDLNRRITVINSSRMLDNADMGMLQKQWTTLLSLKNDRRLRSARSAFEDRLAQWESLIAKKNHAH